MNALYQLERGGFRFELTPAGRIAFHSDGHRGLADEWVAPLLAELRDQREEVADILQARIEWARLYTEWGEQPDDPERDAGYARRLGETAIQGQLPCYDGGQVDLGAAGWERFTQRQIDFFTQKENKDMGIKIEQTTFEAVPTGEYRAVITEIAAAEGKFGPQLQIKCEITTGPHAGTTFLSWVNPTFSPKSRLYEWVEAALAGPVPKSYTFDSDHLIGREVTATLVVRELEGGGEVNRVDRVRRATSLE